MDTLANPPALIGSSDEDKLRRTYETCIKGSHILHFNGVVDAYGHLSARHPTRPDIFIMPCSLAPANVSSPGDLVHYRVEDGSPVDANAPKGYIERFIHSEVYKRFPLVNGVVHSHAPEVIPYGNTSVPLRSCFHIAGFLGKDVPTFDISKHYLADDVHNLLIRNTRLGKALAETLSSRESDSQESIHPVVLMRGHGLTVVGSCPEEAIYRAIYTKQNAAIQTATLGLNLAFAEHLARIGGEQQDLNIKFLKDEELPDTFEMTHSGWGRAWSSWIREVEATALYRYSEE